MKYDEDCLEVESFRQKQVRPCEVMLLSIIDTQRFQSRVSDDKHAERAAKQAEQQRNEMLNSKK